MTHNFIFPSTFTQLRERILYGISFIRFFLRVRKIPESDNYRHVPSPSAATKRIFTEFYNSVALVRERTIPTERPPPVGEVSANFCG